MSVDLLAAHRHRLVAARRAGADFDSAWSSALNVLRPGRAGDGHARALVLDALAETRPSWKAAYNGEPDASPAMAACTSSTSLTRRWRHERADPGESHRRPARAPKRIDRDRVERYRQKLVAEGKLAAWRVQAPSGNSTIIVLLASLTELGTDWSL